MLYSVTLTFIFKVKLFFCYEFAINMRNRTQGPRRAPSKLMFLPAEAHSIYPALHTDGNGYPAHE